MNKPLVTLAACFVLVAAAACIRPVPIEDAQAAYCEDLKAYGQAVQNVRDLPDTATVDDYQEAMKTVDAAYRELENSAWDLADSQNDALRPAYQEMRATLDTIDNETSIVEARTVISDSVTTYMTAYDEVTKVSCKESQ